MYQDSSAHKSQLSRSVLFVRQLKLHCLSDEFITSAVILLSPVFTYTYVYGSMLPHISFLVLDFVHYATYLNTFSITLQIYDSSPGKLAQMAFPMTFFVFGSVPFKLRPGL